MYNFFKIGSIFLLIFLVGVIIMLFSISKTLKKDCLETDSNSQIVFIEDSQSPT